MNKYCIFSTFIFISLNLFSQKIENLRFEQLGKQIIIYYDLTAAQLNQTFDIQVFCSSDGGKTLGYPLKFITGDAGSDIMGGEGKKIVWDVLAEREELVGEIFFEIQIKKSGEGTVTDIDGNIYNIVTIGTQIWMKENLKTTKYNNGLAIKLVANGNAWAALTMPSYCWYKNELVKFKADYGAMYNWYAVNTGNLCPSGWHIPSDAEWTTLTTYLGGESVAGGKLKETGTTHWKSPNKGANNETGFTALPGGSRYYYGSYFDIGTYGYWWTSTEFSPTYAWSRYMLHDFDNVSKYNFDKQYGFSVRCVKDY